MTARLDHCTVEWTAEGARVAFIDTVPARLETCAYPHPDQPHYHVIAHRCGYGDDLLGYCREHELAHALVAQCFGTSRPSCVLLAQARGDDPPRGLAMLEELAAQALQRWVRANERPILAGLDWDRLKAVFLSCAAEAALVDAEVSRETQL